MNNHGYPKEIEKPDIKIEYREAMSRVRLIPWIVAILGIAFLAVLILTRTVKAEILPDDNVLASAIYKAENSKKFPYGIKSINTHGNKEYARKICLNTIRNHKKRHAAHNCKLDFITCLGNRYCPPSAHSLNRNWVRLVKHFLELRGGEKNENLHNTERSR